MTNHPEQQQINQYVKWLVYSASGAVALVPCTTYAWADWLTRGTVDTIVAKYGESEHWSVKLPIRHIEIVDRGKLCFMVPSPEKMSGKLWDKIFAISGPRLTIVERLDMMKALERARLREEK